MIAVCSCYLLLSFLFYPVFQKNSIPIRHKWGECNANNSIRIGTKPTNKKA